MLGEFGSGNLTEQEYANACASPSPSAAFMVASTSENMGLPVGGPPYRDAVSQFISEISGAW